MKIILSVATATAFIAITFFGLNQVKAQSTERVTVGANGVQGNGNSYMSSISSNGQFIAFSSESTNFVPNDSNNLYDLFIHERLSAVKERVNVDSTGIEGNGDSWADRMGISSDGSYVCFA